MGCCAGLSLLADWSAGEYRCLYSLYHHAGAEAVKSLLLFAFLFALINAVFEEMIWRGPLFSSLLRQTSVSYALIVTSAGFGLLHLAIGIPVAISLLFSIAGLFYGIVVYKTNSIYPAILFHFVLNIGMVLSGWILS